MAHLRKQIRDNVVTALTGLSTTGSWVYASRVYPLAAGNLPGLCVYAKSEEVETTTITRPPTQVCTLPQSIEGFAVATSGLDSTLGAISMEGEEPLDPDPSFPSQNLQNFLQADEISSDGFKWKIELPPWRSVLAISFSAALMRDLAPTSKI